MNPWDFPWRQLQPGEDAWQCSSSSAVVSMNVGDEVLVLVVVGVCHLVCLVFELPALEWVAHGISTGIHDPLRKDLSQISEKAIDFDLINISPRHRLAPKGFRSGCS